MYIKIEDVNGEIFRINAVPFFRNIVLESTSRYGRTWRRWKGWSDRFLKDIADRTVKTALTSQEEVEKHKNIKELELEQTGEDTYRCLGETFSFQYPFCGAVYYLFGHIVWAEGRINGNAPDLYAKRGSYSICRDNGEIVFSYKYDWAEGHPNDWKVISNLSGQDERRKFNLYIGRMYGKGMENYLLQYIPTNSIDGDSILPLMQKDFEPSNKGKGFIVKEFGKFAISDTNVPGYYIVTKEKEKVRFIKLLEPFKIVSAVEERA